MPEISSYLFISHQLHEISLLTHWSLLIDYLGGLRSILGNGGGEPLALL